MEAIKQVIKETKHGKWALVCAILGLVSISVGGPIVFWPIAAILYFKGKKVLDNPTPSKAPAYVPAQAQAQMAHIPEPSDPPTEDPKFKTKKNYNGYIKIDAEHRLWTAPKCKRGGTVYNYGDLLNFGLVEDGNTITKGGKGAALAGGIAFGAVGAIVGGITANRKTNATCSKMQIIINVNNLKNPTLYIDLIEKEVRKDSKDYEKAFKTAQTILGALEIISA